MITCNCPHLYRCLTWNVSDALNVSGKYKRWRFKGFQTTTARKTNFPPRRDFPK